jgi:hypothetical protein
MCLILSVLAPLLYDALTHKLYNMLLMFILTVCVLCFHLRCYHQSFSSCSLISFSFLYEQETYVVYAPILIIILHELSVKIIEYN